MLGRFVDPALWSRPLRVEEDVEIPSAPIEGQMGHGEAVVHDVLVLNTMLFICVDVPHGVVDDEIKGFAVLPIDLHRLDVNELNILAVGIRDGPDVGEERTAGMGRNSRKYETAHHHG